MAALSACTAPRARVPEAQTPPARPDPVAIEIDDTRQAEEDLEAVVMVLDGTPGGAPQTLLAALRTSAPAPTALEDPSGDRPSELRATAISPLGRGRNVVYAVDGLAFVRGTTRLDRRSRARLEQLVERLRLGDADYALEVHGASTPRELTPRDILLASRRALTLRSELHRGSGIALDRIAAMAHVPGRSGEPGTAAAESSAWVLVLQ